MSAQMSHPDFRNPESSATWISYTQSGKYQMQVGQIRLAQGFYRKALTMAERLIQPNLLQCQNPTHVIRVYIASCKHLAHSCHALNESPEAETSLLKAHSQMIVLMHNENLSLSLRQAAYHGMHRVFTDLASFYNHTQQFEALAQITAQTKRQSQRFTDHLVL